MKKKDLKTILIIILFFLFIVVNIWFRLPCKIMLKIDKIMITSKIKKEYKDYKIEDIYLTYTNFFSTVHEADGENFAEDADVTIKNDEEQLTILLEKKFLLWKITKREYDYGPNIPNNEYYMATEEILIHSDDDIEKLLDQYINKYKKWIVPYGDGKIYKKYKNGNIYIKNCKEIYKTYKGKIYEYNKDTKMWEESEIKYSGFKNVVGYEKTTEKIVLDLIKKYSN